MSNENSLELYRAHRTGQDKYDYFLLAVAGGAIALAVNQTQNATLAWSQIPLAVAVLSWGISFWSGCRRLYHVNTGLGANLELLLVQSGSRDVGGGPERVRVIETALRDLMKDTGQRASTFFKWQFSLLVFGAVSFVGWHVLEMGLRAEAQPPRQQPAAIAPSDDRAAKNVPIPASLQPANLTPPVQPAQPDAAKQDTTVK
ncbi:MAG: hypothetical protein SGJ20_07180 [Planctomycetota bacterium]|nr:hypothetical protein [Planctomycetota bacterium]